MIYLSGLTYYKLYNLCNFFFLENRTVEYVGR